MGKPSVKKSIYKNHAPFSSLKQLKLFIAQKASQSLSPAGGKEIESFSLATCA